MKARVYVDTSVVGGCEDDEFAEHSSRLMQRFVRGDAQHIAMATVAGSMYW